MPFLSLPKNPRVDKGPQPLMFNPALTTQGELPRRGKRRPPGGCASERMKTQRFSYFADFAARRPAAAGQFRPVSRGGTSCFLREAKPVKLKKVAFSHFFDTLRNGNAVPLIMRVIYLRIALGLPRISAYITARLQAPRSAAERKGREAGSAGERGRAPAASAPE